MIEVHLLRYALAAADSGSFSRAAEQFRVKQSTLSKRVRHLELRIGVPLFTRSTQGVAPTPSGIQFLTRARSIVGELDMLSTDTLALASSKRGRLRIGFHGTLAAGDLRATIEDFRREAPEVELEAIEAGRDQLLDGLDRGRLDVAVVAGEAAGGQALCLWSEPLALGLSVNHPLLERDRLYWTDLRDPTDQRHARHAASGYRHENATAPIPAPDPGRGLQSPKAASTSRLRIPQHPLPGTAALAVSGDRPNLNAHAAGRIPTQTRCAADREAPPGASDRLRRLSQASSRRAAASKQALSPKAGRQGGVRAGLWASRRPDPRPCECATRQTRARDPWRLRRCRQCAHH